MTSHLLTPVFNCGSSNPTQTWLRILNMLNNQRDELRPLMTALLAAMIAADFKEWSDS